MKGRLKKYISVTALLLVGIFFVAKFSGPTILRLYIEAGIGSCSKIPILCMAPEESVNSGINKEYAAELLLYKFPKMSISIPKGFSIVQQRIKKYYKKRMPEYDQPIMYVIHETPDFFINLYPQLKKQGITDDYGFVERIMYARLTDIKDLTSAFFVIMKGIFTPYLGDQRNITMAQFTIAGAKGFINYNLTGPNHYFDCNIFTGKGYFKVYIKDRGARLDLDKVLTIVSTVN
jgi:hypothetical protein